ncbi:hypothetical protein HKBW3S03_01139 [Candidatus Hakubella thermalkaliphila]|uniref:Uncharacterized protein n=1 Tax=Candidatus Hakubella thermalkaliphila TaxID=2754717 RepID=A0A6V8NSJ2_9ACTN|nr:hypothetical protein HKBW3S03_01139 [Candidatus Hakubella thermalkaliphila]GFP23275.1 hypothetical protein HKBW3S09_00742 [Candidatus Hakubella thermalkaliphila]GFP30842.1 hypothetical protein HKBW3S34_01761 [Candidatus Hakubella thermalkaliphila]GFP36860.1 hypothetical protein HKBW3S44_00541 [Candidatus Hakubella thermalkaliphila]
MGKGGRTTRKECWILDAELSGTFYLVPEQFIRK